MNKLKRFSITWSITSEAIYFGYANDSPLCFCFFLTMDLLTIWVKVYLITCLTAQEHFHSIIIFIFIIAFRIKIALVTSIFSIYNRYFYFSSIYKRRYNILLLFYYIWKLLFYRNIFEHISILLYNFLI